MISPFVVHWNSPAVEFIDENGGGSVYGYAKRPRERAAKKSSRSDTQLAKRSQIFDVALGQPGRSEFIEENGGGPGVRLKKTTKGKGRK